MPPESILLLESQLFRYGDAMCARDTSFVPVGYPVGCGARSFRTRLSQEIRLTSHDIGGLHWVAGAFYSSLHSVWNEIGASSPVPQSDHTGRIVLHFPGTITAVVAADRAVRRRLVQVHRSVEALCRRTLLPLQEPSG